MVGFVQKMMYNEDRLQCKKNYENYLVECREGKKVVKEQEFV